MDSLESDCREAQSKLKVGGTYQLTFGGEGNLNNKRIHIRAILDGQVVYRHWSKRKQNWYYAIEGLYYFSLLFQNKNIRRV